MVTLIQTRKIEPRPVVLLGKEYWSKFMNLQFLVDEGAIAEEDLSLFYMTDDPADAWRYIREYYGLEK